MALPQRIPLETFFGNPTHTAPRLSPDGKRIAYLAPEEGVINVWVRTLGQRDDRAVTHDRGSGIVIHLWSADGRYLLVMQDREGDENYHIFAVDPGTGESRDLTPFDGVQARPVEKSVDKPDALVVEMNRRDKRFMDAWRLQISTGELTLLEENPGNVVSWLPDPDLNIRAAWTALPEGGFRLRAKDDQGAWRDVSDFTGDDDTSGVSAVTPDGKGVYLHDNRDRDTLFLVRQDLVTGERETLAGDDQYDLAAVMFHPRKHTPQVVGIAAEQMRWEILDPGLTPVFEALSKLDQGELAGAHSDLDQNVWLAAFDRDDGPVAYWLWRRDTGEAEFLFHSRPDLADLPLATMKPVSFTSRDGLTVHGYLTLPVGVEGKNLPLVLNVHGGPFYRDTWGYHPEAQWFANRGWACLQVNFRGSTGYGKAFMNAGNREWGGKMHLDLVDAVRWATDQGIADPERVAIYGGSYGGYASLVGATFTPELFRCAVAMCGPSNLLTFLNTIPAYWETSRKFLYKRVGDPAVDEDFLKSRSPLFHIDRIDIPLLVAQGANDPRVVQAESEQIVNALKERGHPVEYLLFPDEGHGFAKPENRLKFYAAVDRFLADHLV